MAERDILQRLRTDPGQQTLGQLCKEREAAAQEIERLRNEVERSRPPSAVDAPAETQQTATRPEKLVRMGEVCDLLGLSRSSVYKQIAEGTFPRPLHVGPRAVRWRFDELLAWRDQLSRQAP